MKKLLSLPFAPEEFERRAARLKAKLDARGLDAIILCGPENQYWLTGYETTGFHSFPQAMIVAASGERLLVTRQLEVENATDNAYNLPARGYQDDESPGAAIAKGLLDLGLGSKTVGVEKKVPWLITDVYENIVRAAPQAKLVDVSGLTEMLRAVKSPAEIAYMRQAARAVEAAMRAGLDAVREGATEYDIAADVHHARIKAESHFIRNPSYIVSGPRSALAHATWIGRTLERGDVIFFELGANVRHYDAALIRCAVVGPAPDDIRRAADASRAALSTAIKAIKPGTVARDVHRAAVAELDRHGFGKYFDHRIGYGIGVEFLTWIERGGVSLDIGSDQVLEPNMTLHMIPYFKVQGRYSIGYSETVRVSETGCEVLTSFPRILTEAPLKGARVAVAARPAAKRKPAAKKGGAKRTSKPAKRRTTARAAPRKRRR
ncbi:MAG: Xaa-Pro peptidase family protein [Alphaproteobacteria bacterium]